MPRSASLVDRTYSAAGTTGRNRRCNLSGHPSALLANHERSDGFALFGRTGKHHEPKVRATYDLSRSLLRGRSRRRLLRLNPSAPS